MQVHYKKHYFSIESFFLLIITLLLISPIFAIIKMASTIIASFIFIFFLLKSNYFIKKNLNIFLIFTFSILLTSIIPAIYHSQFKYITLSYFFIISLFMLLQSKKTVIIDLIEFSTFFLFILNIGAILGFIYAFLGGPAIFTFRNPNGLINSFYFSTMTNTVWGNLIRPSGIYDEPGAFSFFITGIATIRHFLGLCQRKTWILLILGLITFSVAHLIFIFFYFLSTININFNNFLKKIFYSLLFFLLIYFFLLVSGFWNVLDLVFFSRFGVDNSGLFPGDNRSVFFFNAINFISDNPKTLLLGQPLSNEFASVEDIYGAVGANPLNPILRWGIFVSWPYYFILFYLILQIKKGKKYFASIGFALILFQREYIYVPSYSMIILIVIITIYSNTNHEIKKNTYSIWY